MLGIASFLVMAVGGALATVTTAPAAPARLFLFGSHHKAGSTLMQAIVREIEFCSTDEHRLRVQIKSLPHLTPRELRKHPPATPTVHVVRDPVEMVTSAYFYHLRTREKWAIRLVNYCNN